MTQDDVIKMAEEAGWKDLRNFDSEMREFLVMGSFKDLEAFAKLVAEHEREACAKLCEQSSDEGEGPDCWDWHSKDYATAIRARGEQA